jgi:hypothetical protein
MWIAWGTARDTFGRKMNLISESFTHVSREFERPEPSRCLPSACRKVLEDLADPSAPMPQAAITAIWYANFSPSQ